MSIVEQLRERADKMATKGNAAALREAADRLEVMEREHAEFFERWHGERRRRERLELAMTEIADHHQKQIDLWHDELGDDDQARYHEERRNVALWHLTPNEQS